MAYLALYNCDLCGETKNDKRSGEQAGRVVISLAVLWKPPEQIELESVCPPCRARLTSLIRNGFPGTKSATASKDTE